MNETIQVSGKKYTCVECQNENQVAAETKTGDIIECTHCGIEYEVKSQDGDNYAIQIIEEEK